MTPDQAETKVILRIGYMRLCVTLGAAIDVMAALGNDNPLEQDSKYENGKSWNVLKPMDTQRIGIDLLTPAEYIAQTVAGDASS